MRCIARLCAAADLGVRFSYVAISFCSASCICVLQSGLAGFRLPRAGLFPAVSMSVEKNRSKLALLSYLFQTREGAALASRALQRFVELFVSARSTASERT